jgi:hypothetical protein
MPGVNKAHEALIELAHLFSMLLQPSYTTRMVPAAVTRSSRLMLIDQEDLSDVC